MSKQLSDLPNLSNRSQLPTQLDLPNGLHQAQLPPPQKHSLLPISTAIYPSPYGKIRLTASATGLTSVQFIEHAKSANKAIANHLEASASKSVATPVAAPIAPALAALFHSAYQWLDRYFAGQNPGFPPALNPAGTPFQKCVWEILSAIPYGETRSYGQIAAQVGHIRGQKVSAQATGQAISKNPCLLMIPCHRVIAADATLRGYSAGLERKQAFLDLEKAAK